MDRVVILGASRGLGAALVRQIAGAKPVTGFARKEAALSRLALEVPGFTGVEADFSTPEGQFAVLAYLSETPVSQVICMAGGGPYGLFSERKWKDHQWGLEVSFLFPARVAHVLSRLAKPPQLILVGSAVAENAADPMAASYAAAKHALKGLFLSLKAESPGWDIRLFSPGYMDTEMLPPGAAARVKGVHDPAQVALDLWQWSLSADESGHRLYPLHPGC